MDMVVYNSLDFTAGSIQTSSSALLIVEEDAVITGASNAAYVIGPMVKRGKTNNQNFIFPVGDNGIYAPIEIEKITSSSVEYTAQYFGCPPISLNSLNSPLQQLNPQGYWTLDRNDANAVGNVTLHWDDAAATGLTDLNSLVVSYYNPILTSWYSLGKGTTTGNLGPAVSGAISNDFGCPPITLASIFTLGSTDINENALLSSELVNFTANKNNDNTKIFLEWKTASEENSDYFIIEKSYDGLTFQEVDKVQAAKNSNTLQFYNTIDDEPSKGNNYYRIQMVDQDRSMNYSNLINVFIKE
jgi:hypothetical protein